ncbi:cation-translocating P-type ATPase [Halobacteria archaeon HArc-gm2]|nr:cation-translocating P-type ATPase [Halobacteria archaeon HArc-gm2]
MTDANADGTGDAVPPDDTVEATGSSDEAVFDMDVPDMDCASCAGKVTSALEGTEGVEGIDARPATGTVSVAYDDGRAGGDDLTRAVESAGYEVTGTSGDGADEDAQDGDGTRNVWTSPRAIKTWVGAVLLAVGIVFEPALLGLADDPVVATVLVTEFSLADVLFLGAVATAGQEILRGGYYSAKNTALDIDFLMSVAMVSAVAASVISASANFYFEAATLAVLFSVAELLERYSMDQARSSLRELMDLSPDEATVRRDGAEVTVPVEEVRVGDSVLVQPGEKIPLDGVVLEGESAVNEAPITGESVPVDKADGDEVYAGTINQAGFLEVEVTAAAGEDTLSRIVELVEDAQANRTEREQFVDRFAGYYTPVMVALAILVATVPPLVLEGPVTAGVAGYAVTFPAGWMPWFVNGITLLVLACPCAFVISTPVTVVSGITSAAKNGVLIKGGRYLESMGQVDAVAMDKTGTITRGELAVTDVVPIGDRTEDDVLACARGLEQRSEHPIGEAIVAHASDAGVETVEVSEFESLTGKGVQATLGGEAHYAGKPGLFDSLGFDLEHVHVVESDDGVADEVRDLCDRQGCLNLAEDTIPRLQSEGKTVVLVGTEDDLEGVVAVADDVRPEAAWTVERLQNLGVEVVMLTGDNERTARAIGDRVGVDDVRAGLLPEEKVEAIEELDAEYEGGVAMVGDGINDAPALATATVGVAMGAAGTDTAIETADVALMSDDLSKLPYLYDVAHQANGVIRQNIWASLGLKAMLAVGVPLGVVNLAIAVLLGDAGMTLGVTGNAMRLSRVTPETPDADETDAAA